jgi:diguanylate cyclase (GGDEF)-like protein
VSTAFLRPRDQVFAGRALSALFAISTVLVVTYAAGQPSSVTAAGDAVAAVLVVLLLACAAALRLVPAAWLTRWGVWGLAPMGGVGAVTAMALALPAEIDLAHQMFGLCVLYAASQLRGPAATLVTALAVTADTTLLALLEAPRDAVVDAVFVAAALGSTTVLLVRTMDRLAGLLAALQRQAGVDALTGLVSRRVLDDALAAALAASSSRAGAGIGADAGTALVLLDVDTFKAINDAHGHPVGDDALVHLAGLLRAHVRTGDAVLARLGGDELAVLLPGCSAEDAAARAEQLVEAVRATPLHLPDGTWLALSISVGVAHAPRHASDLRGLYSAADAALYAAKRTGRDRAVLAA